jgi:hypothetical protein
VLNKTSTTVSAPSTTVGSVTLNAAVYAMGANITVAQKGTGSVAFHLSTTPGVTGPGITGCGAVLLTTFTGSPAFTNIGTCTGNAELNGLKAGTYYITAVFSGDPVNEPSKSAQFTLKLS